MKRNSTRRGRGSTASLGKQMAAYDALPASICEALANAAYPYAPYPIWLRFKRGNGSARFWVTLISHWDAVQIASETRMRR